jgi:hypothetical protein
MDLKNAFPLVNHDILWFKLCKLGIWGPVFDIVRAIYRNMQYVVRLREEDSSAFTSNVGILAGDPSSPLFWTLYALDCRFKAHPDDVRIQGTIISSLFHADNLAIIACSLIAVQSHIDELLQWCGENGLTVCGYKSKALLFTASTRPAATSDTTSTNLALFAADEKIPVEEEACYVGMTFHTKGSMFRPHTLAKAASSKSMTYAIFSSGSYVNDLTPSILLKLYMAWIDPHLMHGTDC